MYIYVMTISGMLVAFAGVYQVLGQITTGFDTGIDSGIGFTAITVALLGRSKPGGVFAAGILFGILQGGSYTMQASQGVNVNIIPVIESVIVLFLAAPPLVRAIFRTPAPGSKPRRVEHESRACPPRPRRLRHQEDGDGEMTAIVNPPGSTSRPRKPCDESTGAPAVEDVDRARDLRGPRHRAVRRVRARRQDGLRVQRGNGGLGCIPLDTRRGRAHRDRGRHPGLLMAIASAVLTWRQSRTPFWYIAVFAVLLVAGFLVWSSAGNSTPFYLTDLLAGTVATSTPLIYGALGGVISERVGVTNIAIEGQLLAGAFCSEITATITKSAFAGLIAAAIAGVLVSFILGAFTIRYWVNQVIVGVVLNSLVIGLTTFFYQEVLVNDSTTAEFVRRRCRTCRSRGSASSRCSGP